MLARLQLEEFVTEVILSFCLIVSDEKKNGLDAGTISGIDEIGVLASTNI